MRIGIVAAEPSGDLLGAGLMEALQQLRPDVHFEGIGGPAMLGRELQGWFPMEKLSVMGLVEVLAHLPELFRMRRKLIRRWKRTPPDLFIGVDAPDFNLTLERALRQTGVPTVHYVSPTVWAWRERRVPRIRAAADLVLTIFPFEQPFLETRGIRSCYVGHPLAAEYPLEPDRAAARSGLDLPPHAPLLALLPGSRRSEVARLARPFLQTALLCRESLPTLQVVTPLATAGTRELFARELARVAPRLPLKIIEGETRNALSAADVVLVASGTATLEALLCKRPMVVGYKLNPLTYRLIRQLNMMKIEHVAMANLLSASPLAPEFIQHDCVPGKLAPALLAFFHDQAKVKRIEAAYRQVHQRLAMPANELAARAVIELWEERTHE